MHPGIGIKPGTIDRVLRVHPLAARTGSSRHGDDRYGLGFNCETLHRPLEYGVVRRTVDLIHTPVVYLAKYETAGIIAIGILARTHQGICPGSIDVLKHSAKVDIVRHSELTR